MQKRDNREFIGTLVVVVLLAGFFSIFSSAESTITGQAHFEDNPNSRSSEQQTREKAALLAQEVLGPYNTYINTELHSYYLAMANQIRTQGALCGPEFKPTQARRHANNMKETLNTITNNYRSMGRDLSRLQRELHRNQWRNGRIRSVMNKIERSLARSVRLYEKGREIVWIYEECFGWNPETSGPPGTTITAEEPRPTRQLGRTRRR